MSPFLPERTLVLHGKEKRPLMLTPYGVKGECERTDTATTEQRIARHDFNVGARPASRTVSPAYAQPSHHVIAARSGKHHEDVAHRKDEGMW